MNKKEFAMAIANKADLSVKDAEAFISAYQDVIADAIKSGDKVVIGGFGTYELKTKAARTGFNHNARFLFIALHSSAIS